MCVHERLQRGGRVVHVAAGTARSEAEAAVAVLLALDPARGIADRGEAGRMPDRAQGEDREGTEVDLMGEGVIRGARAKRFRDEVAPGERVGRRSTRAHSKDRALGVAEAL